MNRTVAVALALAVAAIALIVAARSPPAPIGCFEELVAASACLPHVAALPEEARAPPAPSAACCKAVLAAVLGADGGPPCLCHLIRRPGLFGFPVNASRIAALFSSCSAFGPPRRRRFLYGILPRSPSFAAASQQHKHYTDRAR
nr:PREDICTED: uncharacterized protein LOC103991057 [Musa acuminata subsp. malaccensis]